MLRAIGQRGSAGVRSRNSDCYSMTSSARCCRNKGTSRPSALAVLRLITILARARAVEHALPVEFFARVIWQESRFDARAVSPKGAYASRMRKVQ
jgi:soluble lytic murein transglycosylase-like protein